MNQEYYGTPAASQDFLAHYGVKGMKWGVRRALQRGDINAVRKHYIKAAKKLAKLEKIGSTNSKKYAVKAAAYGTGAALAGGLAIAGTGGVAKGVKALGRLKENQYVKRIAPLLQQKGLTEKQIKALNSEVRKNASNILAKHHDISGKIDNWGKQNAIVREEIYQKAKAEAIKNAQAAFDKNPTLQNSQALLAAKQDRFHIGDVSNNTLARIGAGTLAAGLGVAAARNTYRAKNGAKYRAKAARFREAMNDTFDGIDMSHVQPKKRKRRS